MGRGGGGGRRGGGRGGGRASRGTRVRVSMARHRLKNLMQKNKMARNGRANGPMAKAANDGLTAMKNMCRTPGQRALVDRFASRYQKMAADVQGGKKMTIDDYHKAVKQDVSFTALNSRSNSQIFHEGFNHLAKGVKEAREEASKAMKELIDAAKQAAREAEEDSDEDW